LGVVSFAETYYPVFKLAFSGICSSIGVFMRFRLKQDNITTKLQIWLQFRLGRLSDFRPNRCSNTFEDGLCRKQETWPRMIESLRLEILRLVLKCFILLLVEFPFQRKFSSHRRFSAMVLLTK